MRPPSGSRGRKRPSQTPILSNPDRTCQIERPPRPKGWTVNEIPSTPGPDPSKAVHERRLSFVPRLATPPPRSRRYPPPYPCSRRPASMVLRHPRTTARLSFFQDSNRRS
ncbi:hypothetical protein GQ55_3G056000 [Panicum hallii var. hallii]|uniref:Uncharacterized protein n=1 Tax=Panicum hallii var. hallii TaxID=1504633 RepID=A0A2T7E634_9POAL|nr:hypothetical protein GQ55_3G056000 [Panicum hallii var. hallii]